MTPEQVAQDGALAIRLLLYAVTAVTGALVFVCKILWGDKQDCKKDRAELRQEIESVKTTNGTLGGFTYAVGACDKQGCGLAKVAREIIGSQDRDKDNKP